MASARLGATTAGKWRLAGMVAVVGISACELEEVTVVEVDDVVVAEVQIQIGQGLFGGNRVNAFLHRTVNGVGEGFHPVPGASVIISRADGSSFELAETAIETCVTAGPVDFTGSCYWMAPSVAARFEAGERLEVRIELPSGGTLRGVTHVPGDFELRDVVEGGQCVLPPDTPLTVRWSPAAGAWAYINETAVFGLKEALALRGIELEDDPLELLGLSISSSDTTIVFPGEFGVFNRFELEQDVATSLQEGLPPGTRAPVTITAADRNYVNWVRGGNFNPSGQVRIPSLVGAGTGVFASTVTRTFEVVVNPDPSGGISVAPACPSGG